MRRSGAALAVAAGLVLSSGRSLAQDDTIRYANTPPKLLPFGKFQRPYRFFFDQPLEYYGPGRDKPPPADLAEVKIGFLGPIEGSRDSSRGRRMLQGAMLAIEQANAQGGYHGLPFRLVVRNDLGRWGASSNELVALHEAGVWGTLGSIDGANTHIMLRIALKIDMPLVVSGDTDPTLTETLIPWLIRVSGDDRQTCYALALHAHDVMGYRRVAVLRVNNRYGRVGTAEFRDAMRRLGAPLVLEMRFTPGDTSFTSQLEHIRQAGADAVLVWGDPEEAGRVVRQMRELGMDQPVLGSDRVVSQAFLDVAGAAAEGVVGTYLYNPQLKDPLLRQFGERYRTRFGEEPETFAAHAYDGMNLLLEAIRVAGLNRVLIRDRLMARTDYRGVTGPMVFDATHNDIGPIWMVRVVGGGFEFSPAPSSQNAPDALSRRKDDGRFED